MEALGGDEGDPGMSSQRHELPRTFSHVEEGAAESRRDLEFVWARRRWRVFSCQMAPAAARHSGRHRWLCHFASWRLATPVESPPRGSTQKTDPSCSSAAADPYVEQARQLRTRWCIQVNPEARGMLLCN